MSFALRIKGDGWSFVRKGVNYDYEDSDVAPSMDRAMQFASREAAEAALSFQSNPDALVVEEVDE